MNDRKVQETLTVNEIRQILKIGINSAYTLIHSHSFPVRKVGHSYRIPSESFYKWLGCSEHADMSGRGARVAVKL
jgi:excisionase family DNA binding protein